MEKAFVKATLIVAIIFGLGLFFVANELMHETTSLLDSFMGNLTEIDSNEGLTNFNDFYNNN